MRKSEAKNLLQPYLNRANEQSTSPSREHKSATFEAFSNIWESDYLCLSKPSTRNSVKTQLKTLRAEFGQRDMRQIDAGDVQRIIARMTAKRIRAEDDSKPLGNHQSHLAGGSRTALRGCRFAEAEASEAGQKETSFLQAGGRRWIHCFRSAEKPLLAHG